MLHLDKKTFFSPFTIPFLLTVPSSCQVLENTMSSPKKLSFLLGVRAKLLPEIPTTKGNEKAAIEKDCSDVVSAGDDKTKLLLQNKVKKCCQCGKPNGFTLAACNSCGTALRDTEISFTNNIFVSFILGIQKGPFPFSISIRYQDDSSLLFDDLLALSPMHFNAIPTKEYIPDWRYLLRNPKKGRKVITDLLAVCHVTAEKQFLSNEIFSQKLHKQPLKVSDCLVGFNYPPSQYQLHIQYMSPVLLPHQRYLYQKGLHYTPGRFFPFEYVEKCLELASNDPLPHELLQDTTDVGEIIAYFKTNYQYSYETVHAAMYSRAETFWEKYANWRDDDFDGEAVLDEGETELYFLPKKGQPIKDPQKVQAMIIEDKAQLQNYGRPYNAEGKPVTSYYSFPKSVADLVMW